MHFWSGNENELKAIPLKNHLHSTYAHTSQNIVLNNVPQQMEMKWPDGWLMNKLE